MKNDRMIEHDGRRHSISEWSRILGIKRTTLSYRLMNMSVDDALNMPVRKYEYSEAVLARRNDQKKFPELCCYPDCFNCVYDDCVSDEVHDDEIRINSELSGLRNEILMDVRLGFSRIVADESEE